MTSTAAATGLRAWVATRDWAWLTPLVMRRVTVVLLTVAFVMAATVLSGSTSQAAPAGAAAAGATTR